MTLDLVRPSPARTPPTERLTFAFEACADGARTGGHGSVARPACAWLPDGERAPVIAPAIGPAGAGASS